MIINFVIGTKAQYIKCIPVINEFLNLNFKVSLYDLKQHSETTKNLRKKISKNYKYIELSKNHKNLGTYSNLIFWFVKSIFKILLYPKKEISHKYCFVHGDTLSTLLGILFIKRNGGILVLLEAGHPVPGIFKHFPESIIRLIAAKLADIIIVNGKSQINQLKVWGVNGKVIEIDTNTIYDSFKNVKLIKKNVKNKVTIAIHRTENLNNRKNMELLVDLLIDLPKKFEISWFLHIPTRNKLQAYKLIDTLEINKIKTSDLIQYDDFINELYNSEFVITDGAGIVEECQLLGIPTLVWRDEHLDQEHLFEIGKNLYLSKYSKSKNTEFINNYNALRTKDIYHHKLSPSKQIVEQFLK